jgi:hypothetical protein
MVAIRAYFFLGACFKIFSTTDLVMETIFTLGDVSDDGRDVNLDDLYDYQKQKALEDLALYNKILSRIHVKVRTASRQRSGDQTCWYVVPETLIGVPRYDARECTAYLIDKLRANGFMVRYTHPHLLLLSWAHWVPSYVRSEIKKKTGVALDGYGATKPPEPPPGPSEPALPLVRPLAPPSAKETKTYRDIDSYKPSGNLVYGENLLKAIHTQATSDARK